MLIVVSGFLHVWILESKQLKKSFLHFHILEPELYLFRTPLVTKMFFFFTHLDSRIQTTKKSPLLIQILNTKTPFECFEFPCDKIQFLNIFILYIVRILNSKYRVKFLKEGGKGEFHASLKQIEAYFSINSSSIYDFTIYLLNT